MTPAVRNGTNAVLKWALGLSIPAFFLMNGLMWQHMDKEMSEFRKEVRGMQDAIVAQTKTLDKTNQIDSTTINDMAVVKKYEHRHPLHVTVIPIFPEGQK